MPPGVPAKLPARKSIPLFVPGLRPASAPNTLEPCRSQEPLRSSPEALSHTKPL